jgi:rubrerythrin
MSGRGLTVIDAEADTAAIAGYEATRRDAVRRGLIGAGAVISASAIPSLLRIGTAFANSDDDASILESAIEIEQTAVIAYATGYDSGLLEKPVGDLARLFGNQEQEHADALSRALRQLGGTVPKPPAAADVKGLGTIRNQTDFLTLAIELENMAVIGYVEAHRKLQSPDLLRTGTQIMSNEGQHLVVLRQALGAGPAASVPDAFEAGIAPPPKPGAGNLTTDSKGE